MERITAIKYTDEHYLTRQDVAELLKNNLVDQIWRAIIDYRNIYKFQYNLKRIERINFDFIISPGVLDKSNMLEREFLIFARDYYFLEAKQSISNNKVLSKYKLDKWLKELNVFAVNNGLKITQTQIQEIISSTDPKISVMLSPLYGYYESLKYLDENSAISIDERLLKTLWEKLDGTIVSENETFYRTRELTNLSLTFINKIYDGAPPSRIAEHMNNLFEFINAGYNVSPFFLAATFYVYFTYISPLEHHSDEVASLMMLHIISLGSYGECSYTIPILSLLYKNKERINRLLNEVRRTGDITYGVSYILEMLLDGIQENCRELELIEIPTPAAFQMIEVEKIVEKEVVKEVEKIIEKEVEVLKQVPIYKDREVIVEVPVYIEKEVIKEVIKEVPLLSKSNEVVNEEIEQLSEVSPIKNTDEFLQKDVLSDFINQAIGKNDANLPLEKNTKYNENLSFDFSQSESKEEKEMLKKSSDTIVAVKEKEFIVNTQEQPTTIKPYFPDESLGMEDYAQDLVERLPQLKFNQALFLSNHRETNKYYTIGQFKKELNCSYETARSSMELLVELGYLKKELLKNKFIYKLNKK